MTQNSWRSCSSLQYRLGMNGLYLFSVISAKSRFLVSYQIEKALIELHYPSTVHAFDGAQNTSSRVMLSESLPFHSCESLP